MSNNNSKKNSPQNNGSISLTAKFMIAFFIGSPLILTKLNADLEEAQEEARKNRNNALYAEYDRDVRTFEAFGKELEPYTEKANQGLIIQSECKLPDLIQNDIKGNREELRVKRETLSIVNAASAGQIKFFEQREEKAYNDVVIKVANIKFKCAQLFAAPVQPQEQDPPRDPLFLPHIQEILPYKID